MVLRRSRRTKRCLTASPPPQPPPIPIQTGNKPLGASDSSVGAVVGSSKHGEAPKTPCVTRRTAALRVLLNESTPEDPRNNGEAPAAAVEAAATPGECIAAQRLLTSARTYCTTGGNLCIRSRDIRCADSKKSW